ncbi:hypothetical protein [Thiobacillus denitrificans]|uniref:hypothetical protein n=1 Tax=Thiobacillus denitrificans TaxID=36861 RepID=UPI00035F0C92|nr:hypothetical protein [Thiobacillus denitrificans]
MSDEIKTNAGRVVGHWDGQQATQLMSELANIRQQMLKEGSEDKLIAREMPHRDQLPEDLHSFKAYHIWGCDAGGNCVVGTNANRIESIQKVRSFSLIEHH